MLVFGKFCVRTKLMIPILDDYGSPGKSSNFTHHAARGITESRIQTKLFLSFVLTLENFLCKSSFSLLEK